MDLPVVLSGLFTRGQFGVHHAPRLSAAGAVFVTNNVKVARVAKDKGWTPVLLEPAEGDAPVDDSLLSKRVKFLEILDAPQIQALGLDVSGGVLYCDHKFFVRRRHVAALSSVAKGAAVVIRATPRPKSSIWEEVEEASRQPRYAKAMPRTIDFLRAKMLEGFRPDVRICNTGLIYYASVGAARPLARAVLEACEGLSQPECQIFWALFSQSFERRIRVIEWRHPAVASIRWKDPAGREVFPDGRRPGLMRRSLFALFDTLDV